MGTAVFLFSVFVPAYLLAESVVHVPSQISPDAIFTYSANDKESYRAVRTDGAQTVVGEAAVITATLGSLFSLHVAEEPPRYSIELEQGSFRIHVGSEPVTFVLDGCSIETRKVELIAVRLENAWLFEVGTVFSDGKEYTLEQHIKVCLVRQVEESSEPEPYPVSGTVASTRLSVTTPKLGAAVLLEPGVGLTAGSEAEKMRLKKVSSRLASQRSGPMLRPAEIEDEQDLASHQKLEDSSLAEIEIDPIEIEPSCIEICLD